MEMKSNKSTELRPEGNRILDAPFVEIDLKEFLENIKDEKAWKTSDRNAITVYKTDGMRIVLIALHEGAVMTRHVAQGVINVHVLDGVMNFSTDEKNVELTAGKMVTLHKGVAHRVEAIKKCVFLLTVAA